MFVEENVDSYEDDNIDSDGEEESTPFAHPFTDFEDVSMDDYDDPRNQAWTLTDLRMCELSYAIRSKPSWWTKYKDSQIRERWQAEGLEQEINGDKLSPAEVRYVLDELAGYEKMRDDSTGVQASCFGRIYESDSLVPEHLKQALVAEVQKLEDIPEEAKDWHPKSNDMVLDLVHPSLYCGVYGRTLVASGGSKSNKVLEPLPRPTGGGSSPCPEWSYSEKFQWLPTDFEISADGTTAKALSYINNLHPSHHVELYGIIESIVARFSHLFDRVLTDLHVDNPLRPRVRGRYKRTIPEPRYPPAEGEMTWDEWRETSPIVPPTVSSRGYSNDISKRKSNYTIRGRKVQVIVKLANIHLTPEKPEYEGGSWHVEGMANERIVASGIYYYSEENISESRLAFRTAVNSSALDYDQDDEPGLRKVYGLDRSVEANQVLGSVKTCADRCIAFPNIYQHKVSPFKLTDPTKPGYRKILALFLVDPTITIPSTSVIPPQQSHWAKGAIDSNPKTMFSKLPVELIDMITESTGTLMSDAEAKRYRLELMLERTAFIDTQDNKYFATEFNMCEH